MYLKDIKRCGKRGDRKTVISETILWVCLGLRIFYKEKNVILPKMINKMWYEKSVPNRKSNLTTKGCVKKRNV